MGEMLVVHQGWGMHPGMHTQISEEEWASYYQQQPQMQADCSKQWEQVGISTNLQSCMKLLRYNVIKLCSTLSEISQYC